MKKITAVAFISLFLLGACSQNKNTELVVDNQPNEVESLVEYRSSDFLDFSILLPSTFVETEHSVSVTFKDDRDNVFKVDRVATNFDSIDSYYEDLHEKNNLQDLPLQPMQIKTYDAVKVIDSTSNKTTLTYSIYVNGLVYSISTDSPALFEVLDGVALSFEYLGE